MQKQERGFTLIELITVVILISLISVTLFSRLGSVSTANLQAGRDDLIAALFFAQQSAMARSNIQVILTANSVSVTENGTPLIVHSKGYPLTFPSGVTTTSKTLTYDKLGKVTAPATPITITLSANGGASATVTLEESGYAH
jgi:MSHA pilin protein MshC